MYQKFYKNRCVGGGVRTRTSVVALGVADTDFDFILGRRLRFGLVFFHGLADAKCS